MESRRSIRGGLAIVTFCCFLILAVLPAHAVEELGGITPDASVLDVPGKIAVGADGIIYVVDAPKKQVSKFSAAGQYLGAINLPGVSAVAISSSGTLYAGSNQNYSVAIINKKGAVSGYLGKGVGEFLSIRDIAIDPASGRIYVTDAAAHEVKVFSSAGASIGKISSLHQPVSVTVAGSKIYVIDSPEVLDPISPTPAFTTGTRISIFSSTYALLSTIDDTADFGLTFRPTEILVSATGTIYVSDAWTQSVLLFDATGKYLGEIGSAENGFTASAIAFSPDGSQLFVSSGGTRTIHRFSLAGVL